MKGDAEREFVAPPTRRSTSLQQENSDLEEVHEGGG
jgi:hypothetical protein